MKQSALTALVTITLSLSSGAVLAYTLSGRGRVTDFSEATGIITVTSASEVTRAQVLEGTGYGAVDCPDLIPGVECRNISNRWNLGVLQKQSAPYFRKLLREMGTYDCRTEYVRSAETEPSGAYGRVSIRPTT
ncbi:MAG TPA: hypothetical protein VLS89_07470 [Candidatus Nanopelagicales bacterium]|nr:hypothetical protein [Candidatus Nanopelagicales bacterium]